MKRPASNPGTPQADVEIDLQLVRRLLADQHPDLAGLPLERSDSGWDNVLIRLGSDLAVRIPRREIAAQLLLNEQRWLPGLAARLPLAVPAPVRLGKPGCGYPWSWSIVPWLPGEPADLVPPNFDQAARLGEFLRALHVSAPPEAPENRVRGVPLRDRQVNVEQRMQRLSVHGHLDDPRIRRIWDAALTASVDTDRRWLHGDLHPRNVLTDNEALSAIIDWGDITSGDVATDLASIWMLFEQAQARQLALDTYGPLSKATRQRAMGWAVLFGVVLLETGLVDNPRHAEVGRRTLARVAQGDQ